MASLDGIPLSEYYLKVPTPEQRQAYHAARLPALVDPLERGVLLAWNGPNLRPETLPPPNYPHQSLPEPSPNPPRPLLPFLLTADSPSQGGTGWSLKLLEPVKVGEDQLSQIWRCRVVEPEERGRNPATVVLKLRQQSLFPQPGGNASKPDIDYWNWRPASHLVQREATVYSRTSQYQGRDLPLCYGFYLFTLPCGETSIGVVLEDLVEEAISLSTWFSREALGKRLTIQTVLSLAFELFHLQHRMNSCRILDVLINFNGAFVIRDGSRVPKLLIMGFGDALPWEIAEHLVAEGREDMTEEQRAAEGNPSLVQDDQGRLECQISEVTWPLGLSFRRWIREEPEGKEFQRGLPFLDLM